MHITSNLEQMILENENINEPQEPQEPQLNIGAVSSSLFVGCEVKLKSNEYSTGVIVGKSRRGKGFWKVEWYDGSGITNTFGGHLDCY